ncbi:hypothetical protein MKX03_015556 [Papaver bracteatum]|nr:hypothetical protein MKX03_015556 [Papaver bracteatum]
MHIHFSIVNGETESSSWFNRYTESLYSLFSLGGIYHLLSGGNTIAVLLFALSGFTRSNGMLNAGFICYQAMHQAYDAIFQKKRIGLATMTLIHGALRSLCIFSPFVAFQAYGYHNLCQGIMSYETRPWCKERVPFLYDFLQGHYWYAYLHKNLPFCSSATSSFVGKICQ